MGSLFDTIGGLPVHSLVVHAVVVLVPLVALGAILMAFWPSFSRRFGTLIVVVAAGAAAATVVAKESGEQLAGRVGSPEPHVDLGSRMRCSPSDCSSYCSSSGSSTGASP
jgi:hypothetical protein